MRSHFKLVFYSNHLNILIIFILNNFRGKSKTTFLSLYSIMFKTHNQTKKDCIVSKVYTFLFMPVL